MLPGRQPAIVLKRRSHAVAGSVLHDDGVNIKSARMTNGLSILLSQR